MRGKVLQQSTATVSTPKDNCFAVSAVSTATCDNRLVGSFVSSLACYSSSSCFFCSSYFNCCFLFSSSSISSSVFIVSWPTTLDEPWPKRTRAQSELVRLFAKHLSFDYNLTVNVTSHRVGSPGRARMVDGGFLGFRAGKIKCSTLLLIVKIILLFQPFCVCLWKVLSVFSLRSLRFILLPYCSESGSGCGLFCSRAAISEIYSPTIVYTQLSSTASFLFIMSELSLAHSYFISWKIKLRLVYGPQNTAKGWLTLKCLLCIHALHASRPSIAADDEAQMRRGLWDIYLCAAFE